jgi:flagellar protein FlaG
MKVDTLSSLVTAAPGGAPAAPRAPAPAEADATAVEQPAPAPDREQISRAVEALNRQIATAVPNLRFSVDEATGKTVVRVVDTSTGEIIRQVPSDELLAISRSIDRLQGLLLDREV